jgi:5-methyltetrahydrofolate--homocysteine methyltransferase
LSEQKKYFTKIREEIISFDVDAVKTTVLQAVEAGIPANKLVDIMSEAMEVIGKKYETGEYFVTELIIGGETMKEAIEVLQPYLTGESSSKLGDVVVATVAGDIHDIGKNIFVTLLATAGFNVIDLGVDISAEKIVDAVREHRPIILGLSALLTTNLEQFPIIVAQLTSASLRDKVRVIVGGATVTEAFAQESGVDGYAKTALAGVEICKNWAQLTD